MINYHNRRFKVVSNSENGEVDDSMIFHYLQQDNVVTCTYRSDQIKSGHLMAIVDAEGNLDMRYHQVNRNHQIMTGTCQSVCEIMDNGKLRLREQWEWTSGDKSKGSSVLEEL